MTDDLQDLPNEIPSLTDSAVNEDPSDASAPANQPDRGRRVAFAILGGLFAASAVLVAVSRGKSHPNQDSMAVAVLTGAELPLVVAPLRTIPGVPLATSSEPQRPKVVPLWRVSSLDQDPNVEVLKGTIGKHGFAASLAQVGLSRAERLRVAHAVEHVRRIERSAPKDTFVVARERAKGAVLAFEYVASPTDVWQAKAEGGLEVTKLELAFEKRRTATSFVVTTDLAKALAASGLRPEATDAIDEALEGYGDNAVVRPGIRLRVVGHEDWVEGALARSTVDAVEYVPKVGNALRLYLYEREASASKNLSKTAPHPGFYDARGQQPFRGMFRSPLPLARMTSRFNPKRMHPVLHVVMPHNGVDFGASAGTPVFASGPGTVSHASDSGPCGNMVQIEHEKGLSTAYCHLSRFVPGLHSGQHVEARQLVGYVGQTGRATGPHLHFAVKRGGVFVDPMVLKLDGVHTLPPADREAFAKKRAELDPALEALALPSAEGIGADEKDDTKDDLASDE